MKINEVEFIIFDFETTGLNAFHGDEICEVAGAKFKNGKTLDTFLSLVNPLRPISAGATSVNGITDEMVKDAPTIERILPEFINFIGDRTLVAHNASFDLSFFSAKLFDMKLSPLPNIILDTLTLSRKLYSQHSRHNLPELRRRFEIDLEDEHRALSDVIATCKIFDIFLSDLKKQGANSLDDVLRFYGEVLRFPAETKYKFEMPPVRFLEDIQQAMSEKKSLEIEYLSPAYNFPTKRMIDPYELVRRRTCYMLVAYCHKRNEKRTFRVDRIQNLVIV